MSERPLERRSGPRTTPGGWSRAVTGSIEGLRMAFESLGANRIRAGLTVLGVAIGVGCVVAMAALITGVRSSVQEGIEAAGPRTSSSPGSTSRAFSS